VKHLSDSPFEGVLLTLPLSIRLVCKGLDGPNTLDYYEHL